MEFNLVTFLESCSGIIEANADFVKLIYYSHLPVSIVALLVGGFVFLKKRDELLNKILFLVALSFSVWSILDLISWVGTDSRLIMFSWSLLGVVNSLVFTFCFYFVYVFVTKKDASFGTKLIVVLSLLPIVIFTPTSFNLSEFDVASCQAVEGGYFVFYYYFIDLALFLATIIFQVVGYRRAQHEFKRQILLLSFGIDLFLLSFIVTGFLASYLEIFTLVVYGLFGMVFFLGFITYLIVKYQAFNVKLIGAQALVVGLISLIGSELFFVEELTNYILVAVTFTLAGGFGIVLIRSVKEEVKRKEELQALSEQLAGANKELKRLDAAKSEFISIASHQLRTPITAIKGYISLVLEGSYGKVIPSVQDVLNKVYMVNNRMSQLVEDLLSVSRIESGRVQYNFIETQLEPMVADIVDMFALMAKDKKLTLKIKLPGRSLPKLFLDVNKIREVISNLIDNAIKYTKDGGVTVSVEKEESHVIIKVKDTGIGVDPSDTKRVFEKFTRSSETMKLDVSGTGLGLYVGKNFVEAHGGVLAVESEGPGKGSAFIIKLPLDRPQQPRS
ncbi:MAG: hypothetical protein KBD65_01100 [Candidatus Moranbacteria bacterium]|nr:hypothetical protein [Candidatus Moranbacteria bacterium]